MLNVTKVFRFEAAHAISNHSGPCKNIHGHGYELHVAVTSPQLDAGGMIMDFGDLKEIVHKAVIAEFDHALILNRFGSLAKSVQAGDAKLVLLEAEPTAEYLLGVIAARLHPLIPPPVSLLRLTLWETNTSYAEWERERNTPS